MSKQARKQKAILEHEITNELRGLVEEIQRLNDAEKVATKKQLRRIHNQIASQKKF